MASRFIQLILTALLLSLAAVGEPVLPGVGTAMQTQVAAGEIAGVVTLVTTKDEIIHWEATGFARLEPQVLMNREMVFWIASTSKVFAGVAILMLQDEGKLRVTDPVARYLPEFAGLRTTAGEPADITITHLLTHMSGLKDIDRSVYAAATDLAGLMKSRQPLGPSPIPPGRQYKYSNFGFDIVGRIVEVVSGKSYDAFLAEKLFAPLGMTDTTFYPDESQQCRLAASYAKTRGTGALEFRPSWSGFSTPVHGHFPPVPGGGLFSSAHDLARFCQMLLQRGSLGGRRFLSEDSYVLLTSIHTGELPTSGRGWGLGCYVVRGPQKDVPTGLSAGSFGHPGAMGTHLIIDPEKGLGYVLLLQRPNLPDNFDNAPTRLFVEAVAMADLSTGQSIPPGRSQKSDRSP